MFSFAGNFYFYAREADAVDEMGRVVDTGNDDGCLNDGSVGAVVFVANDRDDDA